MPKGALSLFIAVEGRPEALYFLSDLVDPAGRAVARLDDSHLGEAAV